MYNLGVDYRLGGTLTAHFHFFKLKKLRVIFYFKTGKLSFSLWPGLDRFERAENMPIVQAGLGVDFQGFAAV